MVTKIQVGSSFSAGKPKTKTGLARIRKGKLQRIRTRTRQGRPRRTTSTRKFPKIKRGRPITRKQVSVRLGVGIASSVQRTRPAIKPISLRRRKIKPPTFGRARAGARGRRPIRKKPKGRLVTVRKRPFRSERILRVASRGLGVPARQARRIKKRGFIGKGARTPLSQRSGFVREARGIPSDPNFIPFQIVPTPITKPKRTRKTRITRRGAPPITRRGAPPIRRVTGTTTFRFPQVFKSRAAARGRRPVRSGTTFTKRRLITVRKAKPLPRFDGSDFDVLSGF